MTHQTITLNAGDSITITTAGAPPIQPPVVEPPIQPPIIPPVQPPQGGTIIDVTFDWEHPGKIIVPMGPDDIIAAKFTTGNLDSADNNLPRLSGAEWATSPPSARYAIISETRADFDHPLGQFGVSAGNSVQVPFAVGSGQAHGYPALKKNTSYWFNVRNMEGMQPCKAQGDCRMFVELGKPSGV